MPTNWLHISFNMEKFIVLDINQWIFGAHGDFPRIVLSPGTIEECFEFTIKAFNLADKYQVPVVLLTEQDYGQNYFTVKKFNFSKNLINLINIII